MSKWAVPQSVSPLDLAFGGNMGKLLPPMRDIPADFHSFNNPWVRCVGTWFTVGLANPVFYPKPGIDRRDAMGHMKAILMSFEPKHEHKSAGCAYLMSLWFEKVEWDGGSVNGVDLKPTQPPQDQTPLDSQDTGAAQGGRE